jgi:hypothetical protein
MPVVTELSPHRLFLASSTGTLGIVGCFCRISVPLSSHHFLCCCA